ncbi:MAG: GNAT family N-acetyltransferase [Paracoccaceae bacterium]
MMVRPATEADVPALQSFLRGHADVAMFALGNLTNDGLGTYGARQMRFWLAFEQSMIVGALGLSGAGFLLPVLGEAADVLANCARKLLDGERLIGISAEAEQAALLIERLGLSAPFARDANEPGFALNLDQIVMPPADNARLLRPTQKDRPLLIEWRSEYHVEVLGTAPGAAAAAAAQDIDAYLQIDSHRVLEVSGSPVATTGFNAILPDVVQVGGVYTPPSLRGKGYARLALALHLLEARGKGVSRAILYAFSEPAARAYRSIGFEPAGRMRFLLFAKPVRFPA